MSAWAVFPVGITVVIAAVAWTLWKTRPETKRERRFIENVAAEVVARRRLGMPAKHPEHLTKYLSDEHEAALGTLAAELWPRDEWAGIVGEFRRSQP